VACSRSRQFMHSFLHDALPILEQPRGAVPSSQDWPLAWAQAVVSVGIETRQTTNMKSPLYTVLIVAPGGQACVLIEYLVWALVRSEEHTSELQSRENLVCRLLL